MARPVRRCQRQAASGLLLDAWPRRRREAAAKRDEAIRRATLGIVDDPRLTVGDLLERWLTDVAAQRLRPSSLERYRGIVGASSFRRSARFRCGR